MCRFWVRCGVLEVPYRTQNGGVGGVCRFWVRCGVLGVPDRTQNGGRGQDRRWVMPRRKNSVAAASGLSATSSSPNPRTAPKGAFQNSAGPWDAARPGPAEFPAGPAAGVELKVNSLLSTKTTKNVAFEFGSL